MRVNLFGGPGSGKSKTAARLYDALGRQHLSVELVTEFVKRYAYEKIPVEGPRQIFVFGSQMESEAMFLRTGVKHIVTDSPLFLQCWYSRSRKESFWGDLAHMAEYFDSLYPALNIFLDRDGIPYDEHGRYQNRDEAMKVDTGMQAFLNEMSVPFTVIRTLDFDYLLEFVLNKLEPEHYEPPQKKELPKPKRTWWSRWFG